MSFARNRNGTYSVWPGCLELDDDYEPAWAPFATFHGSYDKPAQVIVQERASREINYYGKWWQ